MIWNYWSSHRKITKAFFLWLSGIALGKDAVFVDVSGRKEFFYFDFPLRYGDKPKKTKILPAGRETTFIVQKPHSGTIAEEDEWINIFNSPEFEIFEKKTRFSHSLPLRWRLSEEEKKTALNIARAALGKFLVDGQRLDQEYLSGLPPRFHLKTDLDVALWVRGQLRGSAVVENHPLGHGISQAAISACRDGRFKPLGAEELNDARIEITLIADLKIPVSKNELKRNAVEPEKGYVLEKDGKKGWFLPEVFNVRQFSNLKDFLADLGREKAGLTRDAYKNSEVRMFEIDDFIESSDRQKSLRLFGPIVQDKFIIHNPEFLMQRLRAAADWLCRIQEPDGNMPPIINPLTGRQTQIDWPRLAFTAWALAEFCKATNEEKYLKSAQKTSDYLKKFLLEDSLRIGASELALVLAYFGELSLALDRKKDVSMAARKISSLVSDSNFEPITFSQIASFFKRIEDRNYQEIFAMLTSTLKKEFEKMLARGNLVSLALWAELVNVFPGVDDEFSEKVSGWLVSQQLPDGSFPNFSDSSFGAYTRGTGKIFEILALEPEKNKKAIDKSLDWLFSMQYDDENIFFIPEEIQPRIIGGFRHDYFNQEAWIDAAGHILLGAARSYSQTTPAANSSV